MDYIFALGLALYNLLFGGVVDVIPETGGENNSATTTATVVRVIDGDTIVVNVNGVEETVRYIGVDTPEPYSNAVPDCYSSEATSFNFSLVADKEVSLVSDTENRDRFDRLLRYVYTDDVFVNQQLLQAGFATTLTIEPNVKFAEQFTILEQSAKESGVGLWSACTDGQIVAATATAPEPISNEPLVVETTQLSAGQQALLNTLGLDQAAFTITAEMISCAESIVSPDRLAEIISGSRPSFLEGVRLVGCYR